MLFFRHFLVISAGAFIALSYNAIAYGAPKPNPLNQLKDNSQIEFSNLSGDAILEKNYLELFYHHEPWGIEIAQITEEQREENQTQRQIQPQTNPTRREINPPRDLRPSANPLLFPTKPEEVTIKTTKEITLLEAIELALRNNKELQKERQNLEVELTDLREARADLFPTLRGEINYTHGDSVQNQGIEARRILQEPVNLINNQLINQLNQPPNNLTVQSLQVPPQLFQVTGDTTQNTLRGSLRVNYGIYNGGRVKALIRQAEKQVRRQQLTVEVQAQQIRFEATRDYYELQDADAQVEINRNTLKDAERSLRDAQLLEQAGLGTRFEILSAQVELAQRQQELTLSIGEQQKRRRELARTLGVGQQVELITAEEVEPAGDWNLTLEESIILAYKNRAELERFLLDREIQKEQETIALAQIRPNIGFNFSYNLEDNNLNNNIDITDNYTISATLNWNIFDGGKAVAQADEAKIRGQIAETNFAQERDRIRLAVESAYSDLVTSKKNIALSIINVQLAEENLRLARLRFQAGVGDQADVIQVQTRLAQARGNRLQAITQYNQSLNELQRQISNLPDSQLFEVP